MIYASPLSTAERIGDERRSSNMTDSARRSEIAEAIATSAMRLQSTSRCSLPAPLHVQNLYSSCNPMVRGRRRTLHDGAPMS